MTLQFDFQTEYDETVGDFVAQAIRTHKNQSAPEHFLPDGDIVGREGINFTMRDNDNQIFGALIGSTFFGGLHIHWLWVAESHRNKGFARELMSRAIEVAKERNCSFAWLDTWEVQGAHTLYDKLGGKVIMRMEDFPPGSALTRYRFDFEDWSHHDTN